MQTKAIFKRPLIILACAIVSSCGQSQSPSTQSEAPSLTPSPTPPQAAVSSSAPTPTPDQAPQAVQPLSPPTSGDRRKIEFDPGTSSATVEGNLASKASEQYTFDATANQTASITITSPAQKVLLTLVSPSGSPIQRYQSGQSSWSGTLPETGSYRVSVVATDQASPYKLNVAIVQKKPGG